MSSVEQFISLAQEAGLPLRHPATAFAIPHPGVTTGVTSCRATASRAAGDSSEPARVRKPYSSDLYRLAMSALCLCTSSSLAAVISRDVAMSCRYFGISRQAYYTWYRRYQAARA